MGATDFYDTSAEPDAKKAFTALVEQARYDYGHAGYTGTIGEKGGYVIFRPARPITNPEKVLHLLSSCWGEEDERWTEVEALFPGNSARIIATFNDKWGPAVAVPYNGGWLFCGMASC